MKYRMGTSRTYLKTERRRSWIRIRIGKYAVDIVDVKSSVRITSPKMTAFNIPLCCSILLLISVTSVNSHEQFSDKSENNEETGLSAEDFERAREMERKPMLAPSHNASMAMFSSNLFEGDMADPNIGPGALLLHPAAVANAFGNALRDRRRRWKDGIVPFTVSRNYNADQRAVIAAAMADYHKYTCIKWVNRNKEKDYISIGPGSGCWSYVGYVGGEQTVSLAPECFVKGVVIHELMHALGIQHEQSRSDRDGYVKINYENIQPGMEGNFQSYGSDVVDNLGLRYDYDSIMHYPEDGFSTNGKPTIVALEPNRNFGQRTGFSLNDVRKIWTYYECKGKYPEPPPIKYCLDQYSNCEVRDCETSPWLNKPCRLTCKLCRKGT